MSCDTILPGIAVWVKDGQITVTKPYMGIMEKGMSRSLFDFTAGKLELGKHDTKL